MAKQGTIGKTSEQLAKLPDPCVDLIYLETGPASEAELRADSNQMRGVK